MFSRVRSAYMVSDFIACVGVYDGYFFGDEVVILFVFDDGCHF